MEQANCSRERNTGSVPGAAYQTDFFDVTIPVLCLAEAPSEAGEADRDFGAQGLPLFP